MRQLIIVLIQMIVFSVNSYCQDHSSYTLLTLDDSMSFRLKRVEFSANRLFGAEITQEKYFMFEFPNGTSTLLIFANRINKKALKVELSQELQFNQLNHNIISENLVLIYNNNYYQACLKPNSLVANNLFFTENENIYMEGEFYEYTDKNQCDVICESFGYKYNLPTYNRNKVLNKKITLISKKNDIYTIKYDFQSLTSSIGWLSTFYTYVKDQGLLAQKVDGLYILVVKKDIRDIKKQ